MALLMHRLQCVVWDTPVCVLVWTPSAFYCDFRICLFCRAFALMAHATSLLTLRPPASHIGAVYNMNSNMTWGPAAG